MKENNNSSLIRSSIIYDEIKELEIFDISSISLNENLKKYNCLCNNEDCHSIPALTFLNNGIIKWKCKCNNLEININDIYTYIFNDDKEENNIKEYLKCKEHNYKKFTFFCNKCQKNICNLCVKDCFIKRHKIIHIYSPEILYIIEDFKEQINKHKEIIFNNNHQIEDNINDIDDITDLNDNIDEMKIMN